MSFFVEKDVKRKGRVYMLEALTGLYETVKDNKHIDNYADTVSDLKRFYALCSDGQGMVNKIIKMSKQNILVNTTTEMIMQDMLNVLLTDQNVEFAKYTYIDNATYNSPTNKKLSLTYPESNVQHNSFTSELETLFKKGGILLVVEMLYVFLKTRTGE